MSYFYTVQSETKRDNTDRRITHLGDLDIQCTYIFCSIKYIFKISFTFRVLLTIT